MIQQKKEKRTRQKAFSTINTNAFITVVTILTVILFLCGALSYFVPQGSFQRDESGQILMDTYTRQEVSGIAFWRVLTAPVRVFAGEDAVTVIMISVFLLIMSGIFNILEKTGGVRTFIAYIMARLQGKGSIVVCITVLVFMLFGSLFGMFEELVTLLPLIIVFMLSMGMDTMTGLGTCLMAACFGFSAAITNPFSVGIASQYAGVHVSAGLWLRVVFFVLIYGLVCGFLLMHRRKIAKDPALSPTCAADLERRQNLDLHTGELTPEQLRCARIYGVFFLVQGVILVLVASVRAISGYAIPILAASFLIFGLAAGLLVSRDGKTVFGSFFRGAGAMLPAVLMIALASSVKLVMEESGIIDTIMHAVLSRLEGTGKFAALLMIYALILFLQLFIGSATAKIVLIMPIIVPIARALGISPNLVILTYCMADGFSDVIMPTNPVLLIGLSMANVSYVQWVKWTWKLQLAVFALSVLVLLLGVTVGY